MRKPHINTPTEASSSSGTVRFAVAIFIFVVIMASAGRRFSQVFDSVESAEAETAVQGYAASVVNIHKNWILQGRPDQVVINSITNKGEPGPQWLFLMNKVGWPINVIDGNDKPDCNALWYALQTSDRVSFSSVLVRMKRDELGQLKPAEFSPDLTTEDPSLVWVCQNIVAQQLMFRYRLDNGKVELE